MMPRYAVGDLQGCCDSLHELLSQLPPEAAQARLYFVGDLINRGPASLATLRAVMALGDRARVVLGNHDLHMLAVAAGVRQLHASDTLGDILGAPDHDELIDWIRHRPLAHFEDGFLMVHAGVLPQWDVAQTLELAQDVEQALRGSGWKSFLSQMFGNQPDRWHAGLAGADRQRITINALTRLRFCTADGQIDFKVKEGAGSAPPGFMPWFDVPERKTADVTMVFGHWSALGLMLRDNVMGLDTGCVWGGQLTAVKLATEPAQRKVYQVACPRIRDPLAFATSAQSKR